MSVTITPVDTPQPARAAGRPLIRRFVRPGAAALSGVLLYLSFPPRPLWWLAVPAFALLGWALRGRRPRVALGLGYLTGLGFLLPLLVWTGEEVGAVPWLALAAVEALFVAMTCGGMAVVSRLPAWPVWGAAVWIAGEAARARVPFGGFPWGKIAFGQADGLFLPLAAVGGTPVLSFAVVLCGLGLYETARQMAARRRTGSVRRGAAAAALLALALPLVGALCARPLVDDAAEDGTATVAAVQGNVPRLGLDFNAQRRAVLDNHAQRTEQLADDVAAGRAPKPDFVLWPENSSDLDPYRNADARLVIDDAVMAIGVPTVVGAVLTPETGPLRNTLIEWDPRRGPVDTYDKRHVQPFGEYIPLRPIVRILNSDVDRVSRDFGPGHEVGVFDLAGTRVGLVTCFEAAFDDAARDTVTHGAQLISVPSNNATFGRSEMTYQQLAMSRVRAVEHSRSVVVPVTSGVSAVIMPDGEIVQETRMFTPDALVAEVPLRSSLTPATRLGVWPEVALLLLAAAAVGKAVTDAVRERRERAAAAVEQGAGA
ncbi:apolipoprotein N-acyltransferase [Streptomyces sp. PKU-EA00015]|uniref:apolipoprotein N-acyltransferase n=1 Tax=Streptomyces sp. PKU-EA00015 TaxID=2748326 RepID=UPI0015A31FAD|nr:apolipoprotein N-acyltransferase [Streptomyces sp. PKU-EA00015]NWF25731.1 apolipoprotein N-acyltransferase [Streptomyces sp. PKU-EA00015]